MSRIAGWIRKGDGGKDLLQAAIHGWSQRSGWQSRVEEKDGVVFGFSGLNGELGIYRSESCQILLDGCVSHASEETPPGKPMEWLGRLFEKHGFEGMLPLLNGEFSLAIDDFRKRTLWLARDRMGVKPLYYAQVNGGFAFASQPGPLLKMPGVSSRVNRQFVALFAACHYRYFDNHPEESPYQDIRQVPAASWMKIQDGSITRGVYWRLEERADFTDSFEALAQRYQELLKDAVRIRLKHSPKPAFTLSGGMDSSSVLATAVNLTGARQHAFSSVYQDKTYDESDEIRTMLSATVEKWHPVVVEKPDLFDLVGKMIRVHDEPVATATWLSHFLVCEKAQQEGFGSLFGGLGGDELNAGEYEYFFYHFADLRKAGQEEQLKKEVARWVEYHDHPIFKKSWDSMERMLSKVMDESHPGRCRPDRDRITRYSKVLRQDYFDLSRFEPVMEHPFQSYLKNRTFQDLYRETIPCCLRAEDRQTTAFNLQNVAPFFDHRLAEFMYRVPGSHKIREGVTKILLREAMKGILPEETRTRIKKTGWNAPAHQWFSGEGRGMLLDLIHSQAFAGRGIYDVQEVQRLADEHEEIVSGGQGRENHMMFFWQLVNLELWLADLKGKD